MSTVSKPSLRVERAWGREGIDLVIGCDEVGRGAIAGPVSVGMVAIHPLRATALTGVRDSKLMTRPQREEMYEKVRRWGVASGVGSVSARDVDELGIMEALRRAGLQALQAMSADLELAELISSGRLRILLDGSFNWLTSGKHQDSLFDVLADDDAGSRPDAWLRELGLAVEDLDVQVRPKADRDCTSVAAASVLAKVERDAYMRELATAHPEYGWESNVGYGSSGHYAGIEEFGVTEFHRVTWLKGVTKTLKEDS